MNLNPAPAPASAPAPARAFGRVSGVYALVDPRTQKTMYIGQSTDVVSRFTQHLDPARYEPNIAKRKWLEELRRSKSQPRLVVLEEGRCSEELDEAETRLIREYKVRGEAELNLAIGGKNRVVSRVFNSKQHEWIELGRKIKACRALLFEIAADVDRMVGGKYSRSIDDVVRRLGGAKSTLDGVLARTFPEWKSFTKVFFGEDDPDAG